MCFISQVKQLAWTGEVVHLCSLGGGPPSVLAGALADRLLIARGSPSEACKVLSPAAHTDQPSKDECQCQLRMYCPWEYHVLILMALRHLLRCDCAGCATPDCSAACSPAWLGFPCSMRNPTRYACHTCMPKHVSPVRHAHPLHKLTLLI